MTVGTKSAQLLGSFVGEAFAGAADRRAALGGDFSDRWQRKLAQLIEFPWSVPTGEDLR